MAAYALPTSVDGLDPNAPLTASHLYRRELAEACPPSLAQVEADGTEERAKAGDRGALHLLLLSLQSYVLYWAGRFARAYSWASPRISLEDLAGEGNAALIERLERAYSKDRMVAYLASVAKYRMLGHCRQWCSPIGTPEESAPVLVESLDRPIQGRDKPTPLADLLPDKQIQLPEPPSTGAIPAMEEILPHALALLPRRQQEVVTRLYGFDTSRETLAEIGHGDGVTRATARGLHEQACRRLRMILQQPCDAAGKPDVYTTQQALQTLGVSRTAFANLVAKGAIHSCVADLGLYEGSSIRRVAQEYASGTRTRYRPRAQGSLPPDPAESERRRQQKRERELQRYAALKADPAALARRREQKREARRARKHAQQVPA